MKYVSLLRGINVSGQKKIKMADLKELYEVLGFENVKTYIQSGNVVFECETDINVVKVKIEEGIKKKFNFDVPTIVIRADELNKVYKNIPFPNFDIIKDGKLTAVAFLSTEPEREAVDKLMEYVKLPEELVVRKSSVYLKCPNGFGRSKLTNKLIEQKLKVSATTRNLKTVEKLIELSA